MRGSSCGCAWRADTLAVANPPSTSMPYDIFAPRSIRSLDQSSPARNGYGAMSTSYGSKNCCFHDRRAQRSLGGAPASDLESLTSPSTDDGDSLPQPRVGAVVVVAVLPYLRKLVARQLDRRLDDPKAGQLGEDLRPAGRQGGHVVGLLEDVRRQQVIGDTQCDVPAFADSGERAIDVAPGDRIRGGSNLQVRKPAVRFERETLANLLVAGAHDTNGRILVKRLLVDVRGNVLEDAERQIDAPLENRLFRRCHDGAQLDFDVLCLAPECAQ